MRRTICLSVLWVTAFGLVVLGCGGAQTAEGGDGIDSEADASSGASEMTGGPQAEPAADDGSFRYPCDHPDKLLDATPLDGPFKSLKAFCKSAQLKRCVEVGPTISYPGGQSMFETAQVLGAAGPDGQQTRIAVKRQGQWYVGRSLGAPDEQPQHDGPLITETGVAFGERLMVNLTFVRQAGADAAGVETIFRRSVTVLCAAGESGIPACAVVPNSWEREDRDAQGQPVGEGSLTQLRYLTCDDGTIVVYGNLERLSGDTAEEVREFIGRRRLKFP